MHACPADGAGSGSTEPASDAFDFQELLAESVRTMTKHGSQAGLDAVVAAIPAVKPLVDSL